MPSIKLWFWIVPSDTPPFKPRQSTWRMTEADARARYGEQAVKVESTLEVRETDIGGAGVLYRGHPSIDKG